MVLRNYLPFILYTSRMRFGFVLVVLLQLCAFGCRPSDSRQALLRLKGKPGDKYVLELKSVTTIDEKATEDSPPAKETSSVTSVKSNTCKSIKDGKTVWAVKTESVEFSAGGPMGARAAMAAKKEEGTTTSIVRDERGVIVGQPKSNPLECELPIQAVRIGDAWRSEARVQGYRVPMLYRVEAFEKVDGKDAVRVSGTLEEVELVELVKPVQTWFEVENGWPIKGIADFVFKPREGLRVDMRIELNRK